jgi:putative hydrolase of the HAD superfamily
VIRAVLFDLDDTIIDRAATVRAYVPQFMRDFGDRFRLADPEQVAAELIRIDRNGYNPGRPSDIAAHPSWSLSPGAAVIAKHWDDHFVRCTQGRAHVSATLAALANAGLMLAVVSNGRTEAQRRKLETLGLLQRFDAVLISEALGSAKPDERIFRAAVGALGVQPRQCMFVGDNPLKDVRAAAALGMRAVWFRASTPWPDAIAAATESIESFPELIALVGI